MAVVVVAVPVGEVVGAAVEGVAVVGVVAVVEVAAVAQVAAELVDLLLGAWEGVGVVPVWQVVVEASLVGEEGVRDDAWAVGAVGVEGYQVALPSAEEACWRVVAPEVVEVDASQEWEVGVEPCLVWQLVVEVGQAWEVVATVQEEAHQQTAGEDDRLETGDSERREVFLLQIHDARP